MLGKKWRITTETKPLIYVQCTHNMKQMKTLFYLDVSSRYYPSIL